MQLRRNRLVVIAATIGIVFFIGLFALRQGGLLLASKSAGASVAGGEQVLVFPLQAVAPLLPVVESRGHESLRGQRPTSEWQGMLVFETELTPCARLDACGLARACVDGRCEGCLTDKECAPREQCVLDHCVRTENVGCRRKADCPGDEACVLSGYTPSTRGNEDMKAECVPTTGTRRAVDRKSVV